MSARPRIGPAALVLAVLTGLVACALGMGLALRAETAFGTAWAALFVIFGLIALISAVLAARPVNPRSAGSRAVAVALLGLLASWCATAGIIGALQESWIWAPLMALPTTYLLRAVVRSVQQSRRVGAP